MTDPKNLPVNFIYGRHQSNFNQDNITSSRAQNQKNIFNNIRTNFRMITQEKLLKICGGKHRYQNFMLSSFSTIAALQTIFLACMPFFFMTPKFLCSKGGTKTNFVCSVDEACLDGNDIEIVTEIYTLIEHFNLFCKPDEFSPKILAIIFSSAALLAGPLFLLNHAIGRRMTLFIYSALQISTCLLVIHVDSFVIFTICFTIITSVAVAWLFSAFMYLVESTSKSFRERAFILYIISISCALVSVDPLYHRFKNYKTMFIFMIICLICLSFFYMILVESPRYARDNYNIRDFYYCMKEIIRINFSFSKGNRRKEALKVILFDEINPSESVSAKEMVTSINSMSPSSNTRVNETPDKNPVHSIKDTNQKEKPLISNDEIGKLKDSKSLSVNFNTSQDNNDLDLVKSVQVDSRVRRNIYKISLPFSRESFSGALSMIVISQIIISFFRTIFSVFNCSIFWFSLSNFGTGNPDLTSALLSLSFLLGTVISILLHSVMTSGTIISACFIANLLIISVLLSLSQLNAAKTSRFSLDLALIFLFNTSSSISCFPSIKESIRNFNFELKSLATVLSIISSLLGFALSAYLTGCFLSFDVNIIWSIFLVTVLSLPMTLMSNYKPKKPFSRIQSPA